jgi:hypothetical protein
MVSRYVLGLQALIKLNGAAVSSHCLSGWAGPDNWGIIIAVRIRWYPFDIHASCLIKLKATVWRKEAGAYWGQ